MATITSLPSAFKKLSPKELESRGLSRKAERWLNINTGETISKRQYQKTRKIGQYQAPELRNPKKQQRAPRAKVSKTSTGKYTIYESKIDISKPGFSKRCELLMRKHGQTKYTIVFWAMVDEDFVYAKTRKIVNAGYLDTGEENLVPKWFSISVFRGTKESVILSTIEADYNVELENIKESYCKIIVKN